MMLRVRSLCVLFFFERFYAQHTGMTRNSARWLIVVMRVAMVTHVTLSGADVVPLNHYIIVSELVSIITKMVAVVN